MARPPDFQALFERAPAACLVVLADAPRYTIVAASDAYLRATLRTRENILGRPLFEAFPDPPGQPAATGTRNLGASLARAIASGEPDTLPIQHYAIQRPDGVWEERHWSPINTPVLGADGTVGYVIHRIEDVTEVMLETRSHEAGPSAQTVREALLPERRRGHQRLIEALLDRLRAEEQLRQQADRLREHATILEFAHLLIREPDDRISHWSLGAERLYGYSQEEALGRISRELLKTEYPCALDELRAGLVENGEWQGELTHRTRTGERIVVVSHQVLCRDERGVEEAVLEINHDITPLKCLEAERERLLAMEQQAHAEAETANRGKDEFIALVAHELRNPLGAILNWARLLQHGGQHDPVTVARASEVILRNAKLQQTLIDDLLDSARIASGKLQLNLETLDPSPIVRAAVEAMRPAAQAKGVRLDADLDPRAGQINGDANRLQQVVWNLLSNAVKFTPKSGTITVRLARADGYLQLTVADTGQGIAPENLSRVFERFHQAGRSGSRRQGGLGLGLALVKHLVELHGGTVEAASAGEGRGASFTIRLPELGAPGLDGMAAPPAEAAQPLAGLRILVVDDDADARDLLRLILLGYGAEAMAVDSVAEALAALKDPAAAFRPGLLISDIAMPGRDGYALIREWRDFEAARGLPPLPAVALSATPRHGGWQHALESGFQAFLAKPVEPARLVAVIRALMPGATGT